LFPANLAKQQKNGEFSGIQISIAFIIRLLKTLFQNSIPKRPRANSIAPTVIQTGGGGIKMGKNEKKLSDMV
jgi:hypothetical protein